MYQVAFSNYFCYAFQYTVYICKMFCCLNRMTNVRWLFHKFSKALLRSLCVYAYFCVCFTLISIYINNVSYRLFKYFPNGTIWMTKALLMHDGRVDYIQMDEQFELFCLWFFFENNEIAIKNRMMIFQLQQYQ